MPAPLPQPTPLLDLIHFLGLDRAYNEELPEDDFVGPRQEPPPLTGWAAAFDTGLDAVVGTFKGLTGLGDQGPAGPTWTNAAAVLGAALPAVPMLKKLPRFAQAIENYRTPTIDGKLSAPFYSRLEEAAAALPKQTFGPRVLGTVQKGEAAAEELALRKVPEFVAAAGNKPIQRAALEAHLAEHPLPQLEVTTLGGGKPNPPAQLPDGWSIQELAPGNRPGAQHTHTLVGPDGVGHAFHATDAQDANTMAHQIVLDKIERERLADNATLERHGLTVEHDPIEDFDEDVFLARDGSALDNDEMEALPQDAVRAFRRLGINGAYLDSLERTPGNPKFAQYQLPGGEKYRETLITMPPERPPFKAWVEQTQGRKLESFNKAAQRHLEQQYRSTTDEEFTTGNEFRSTHFDEPNILVHTRSNEREIPGVGRGMFLEEVQSDWHQMGKKHGYKSDDAPLTLRDGYALERLDAEGAANNGVNVGDWQIVDEGGDDFGPPIAGHLTEQEALRQFMRDAQDVGAGEIIHRGVSGAAIPDAPFKETWPDLALKHHLAEAAANPETKWIGFTDGATQADRYNLRKQIEELHYENNRLTAYNRDGTKVLDRSAKPDDLEELIGKEAAKKLLAAPDYNRQPFPDYDAWLQKEIGGRFHGPEHEAVNRRAYEADKARAEQRAPARRLVGLDLEVGGEGMREFYDKVLPKRLEKIVKPFGGTVERGTMPGKTKKMDVDVPAFSVRDQNGHMRGIWESRADAEAYLANPPYFIDARNSTIVPATTVKTTEVPVDTPMWILKLSPELKERILKYGLPLMAGVAAVNTGKEK